MLVGVKENSVRNIFLGKRCSQELAEKIIHVLKIDPSLINVSPSHRRQKTYKKETQRVFLREPTTVREPVTFVFKPKKRGLREIIASFFEGMARWVRSGSR